MTDHTTPNPMPLLLLAALCVVILFFVPPIAQDLAYHNFSDTRSWLGVPNFGDVMSNLPFVFVGVYGLCELWKLRAPCPKFITKKEWIAGVIACIGFFLVAFGSGYYHWNPANKPLVWDRLPMTIGFMSIFSMMIMERISLEAGWKMLPLLLAAGIASVIYWAATDDLRPYVFVQFFPMLAIPFMLWRYPPRYSHVQLLGWVIFWYVVAKLLEHFDDEVLRLAGGVVSGHSLKHMAAAAATFAYVLYMQRRNALKSV